MGNLLPGQAPSVSYNTAEGSYGFNVSPYDTAAHNAEIQEFGNHDDWHILNANMQELKPDDLNYVPYTIPGESAPRNVMRGMIPAYEAFYSGEINQEQLEAAAVNLTPTRYQGEPSVFGMIFKGIVRAAIAWGAGQGLGAILNTIATAAGTAGAGGGALSGASAFAGEAATAASEIPAWLSTTINLAKTGAGIARDVVSDVEDASNYPQYDPGTIGDVGTVDNPTDFGELQTPVQDVSVEPDNRTTGEDTDLTQVLGDLSTGETDTRTTGEEDPEGELTTVLGDLSGGQVDTRSTGEEEEDDTTVLVPPSTTTGINRETFSNAIELAVSMLPRAGQGNVTVTRNDAPRFAEAPQIPTLLGRVFPLSIDPKTRRTSIQPRLNFLTEPVTKQPRTNFF